MTRTIFLAAFIADEASCTGDAGLIDLRDTLSGEVGRGERTRTSRQAHSPPADRSVDVEAGVDRQTNGAVSQQDTAPLIASARSSFRNHLSAAMRNAPAFEYYEVRPCIEMDGEVTSWRDEGEFFAELTRARGSGRAFRTFWSIYGMGADARMAIGDFVSKEAAHEVMNAILAVSAAVRNALDAEIIRRQDHDGAEIQKAVQAATVWLDDLINQSSGEQRI
jgi:hypothetical protein